MGIFNVLGNCTCICIRTKTGTSSGSEVGCEFEKKRT